MTQTRAIEPSAVVDLELDPDNPRLPEGLDKEQLRLLRYFLDAYQLEEIGQSMAARGYFDEEPLLTAPPLDGANGKRIVVEGNRRLATLKLLIDADLRKTVDAGAEWDRLAEQAAEQNLATVPTIPYDSRDELLDYLGFRHVSGVVPWSAEAKARFVSSLILDHGHDFRSAAKAIGSRIDAVRRQFVAYRTLRQAKDAGYDVAAAQNFFGVYYRAFQAPEIREFLDLKPLRDYTESDTSPLSDEGLKAAEELVSWLFGNDDRGEKRVLTDSRQISQLAQVIANEAGRAALKDSRSLPLALEVAGGDRVSMRTALQHAYRALINANGQAFQFTGDDEMLQLAERGADVAEQVVATLRVDAARPEPDEPKSDLSADE